MSMTNDMQRVRKITKELGSEIIGVGNIFWEKVDLESSVKPTSQINDYMFDGKTLNFHLLPEMEEEEKVKKYVDLITDLRNKIVEELEKKGAQRITVDEYNDFTKIDNYSNNKIYIYFYGGKNGTCSALRGNKKYIDGGWNRVYKYIPCIVNGNYYTINFMRYYIDRMGKVNCIYQAMQFDCSVCGLVNKKRISYPMTYLGMRLDKVSKLVSSGENFCYNPQITCKVENAGKIAELFIKFIEKSETYRKEIRKEEK